MGYEREELLPKGWEKWWEKKRLDRYRELRKSAKYAYVNAKCHVLKTMFLCYVYRNVPHTWIKFVDKRMKERNDEVLVIKLLRKSDPTHKYDVQEHLEANLRYSPFCNSRAWESRNRVKNERNQELKELKALKCVSSFFAKHCDLYYVIKKIEYNKCQEKLDARYKLFERWEEERKAVKEVKKKSGRNTTGYYTQKRDGETLARFPNNCFPSFRVQHSARHPVRQGFTFGY